MLDPISPTEFTRLYDDGPCPQSVDGHRVDNRHGRCEWCRRKVEPSQAEQDANTRWYEDRRLARENHNQTQGK